MKTPTHIGFDEKTHDDLSDTVCTLTLRADRIADKIAKIWLICKRDTITHGLDFVYFFLDARLVGYTEVWVRNPVTKQTRKLKQNPMDDSDVRLKPVSDRKEEPDSGE